MASASERYGTLEVEQFELPSDVRLPDDFRVALAQNLISRLRESGKFGEVIDGDGRSGPAGTPGVRLTGSITKFNKGSRAERYLLGPGFGKTILKAHVQFLDVATGRVMLEKDVDGKVIIGLFGGDSKGATNGLAKEVAKIAKKRL